MAAYERDSPLNMSMREKSLLKRRINKEHNSNFRAGYIHINEDYLHKTGIRGRKRYFLYCVASLTFVLALANVLTTIALLFFLRICHEGMTQLEFLPGGQLVRFLDDADFSSVHILQGMLGGRSDRNLDFYGNKQEVVFNASTEDWSSLSVSGNGTVVTSEDFHVIGADTGHTLLSTNSELEMPIKEATNFHASVVETDMMMSRVDVKDLFVESFKEAELHGAEGVFMVAEGPIDVSAEEDIKVAAGGSLILNAGNGLFVDPNIPLPNTASRIDTSLTNYKVCVCMPSGRVFLVPVLKAGYGCGNANEDVDPCE